ncbi:RNA 2',3'-cyclic phosphodiesterase [Cupriavidus sp. AU9028]|uniref:RNA 2',3'-cyclic phosphodiesterase n=1 Tax=Cupriavidus sp. AU9028 TaxID=2871157 RepID=UPI001C983591|nr:RNA 2',3'-cyclic phosphodiesterase [Cupriavidus sp. AU9028]MBY4896952.1 RNA 2',3'-cyclic phosphodiesterase [Cupriavidus sp. AU9028]
MTRLFVALDTPAELAIALRATVPAGAGLRVSPASQIHLTLRFIGEVDEAGIPGIETALARVRASPFALAVEGVGRFGSPAGARGGGVLWAGVRPEPALLALQAAVESALQAAGIARERRAWHPHLTVARIGPRTGAAAVEQWLAQHGGMTFPGWTVSRFILYESRLLPGGAEHRQRRGYPLAA